MDRRWRPIQDESALNSIAGSNVGGRPAVNRQDRNLVLNEFTFFPYFYGVIRKNELAWGPSNHYYGPIKLNIVMSIKELNDSNAQESSNRPSNRDTSDYFRRPSMRSGAMSTMSDAQSNASRPVQRTNTGRTGTSGGYNQTTTQQTTTEGTRTETTGISRNHSMKTTTTGTHHHHHRGGATVSRNTSMTSATRTV